MTFFGKVQNNESYIESYVEDIHDMKDTDKIHYYDSHLLYVETNGMNDAETMRIMTAAAKQCPIFSQLSQEYRPGGERSKSAGSECIFRCNREKSGDGKPKGSMWFYIYDTRLYNYFIGLNPNVAAAHLRI